LSKTLKTISLIVSVLLVGLLLKNIFSKPEEPINSEIYNLKLKPITFPEKTFPYYNQDTSDPAVQYTRLWKLSELCSQSSQSCLKTFADHHPNNLVQRQNQTTLYGINIGTPSWFELTTAFENYASEVCYSFSGKEMEIEYAKSVKQNLNEDEIVELLKFFNTDLGKNIFLQAIKQMINF